LLQQLSNGQSSNAAPATTKVFEVVSAAVDVTEDDRDSEDEADDDDDDEGEGDDDSNNGYDPAFDVSPGG
jgi:hypothetical protein